MRDRTDDNSTANCNRNRKIFHSTASSFRQPFESDCSNKVNASLPCTESMAIIFIESVNLYSFLSRKMMTLLRLLFGNPAKTPPLSLLSPSVPSYSVGILLLLSIVSCFSRLAVAQNLNQTNSRTDPFEARLVNSMFQRLRVSAPTQWNLSGELCSGAAIDSTNLQDLNPGLKCDCSNTNGSLCHITGLRLFGLDLVGFLPDELWYLTFLDDLDLRKNYFTGPIPASISRLTRMQYMSFGYNALSGELPNELGNLTDLRSLALNDNYFTGSFPAELGNLKRLTQLYFASSGISGVIPQSFANLQSLNTLVGANTQLTGQIPDLIGNWSQLNVLRLQGNSFHGPIPASFSNLTSLTDLRISNVFNPAFSLEFMRNMKSLSILNLRNNNISGSIPFNIGEFQNLRQLDLSFNSLSGSIPDSLFNITTLTHLFLGNNKLTGSLPQQKSSTLQNLDLSYNELSGSFPSWVNDKNLQLNLAANNFTLSDFGSSSLPSILYCLQRNFPCYRGSPVYYNFSINCGGPALRSADGVYYEADDQTSGPATYYVTSSRRWAVSNAGLPAYGPPNYTIFSPSPFANTSDSEMFQTARVSAGSLRYFGLGLENGNYTVNLQFAETEILDTVSWRSVGTRVFDIYMQGNRVEQDFDIKKAAGGHSFTAIQRTYNVTVSENYLEIHLFWAGKGSCCIPNQGTYGPLVSAISATPDFSPTVSNIPPTSGKKKQTALIVGIVVPVGITILLLVFAVYFFIQRMKRQPMAEDELFGKDARPYTFSYMELRAATDDFDPANKLGEGGFGTVFKGTLYDKRVVAVKQLSVASSQGNSQFVAEVATISSVKHRNLVKFYGCCIEGEKRLLVYEYLENKSLDQALFGNKRLHLDWPTRFGICLGVAKGLTYLHEESRVRIVHRDVKASNILLDSNFNPKISDFGLAKLYDDKMTHISTKIAGTIGYLAPEYAMKGHLTEKADVFGFGVLALEIVSGRPNSGSGLEEDEIYLLELAWNMHEKGHEIELKDPDLVESDDNEVKKVIGVALLCTQDSPLLRPSMSRVLAMLSGDTEVTRVTMRPDYLNDWNAASFISNIDSATRDYSHYDSPSISTTADGNRFPINASAPILGEIREINIADEK